MQTENLLLHQRGERQKVEERFAELAEQLARRSAEERQLLLHWH